MRTVWRIYTRDLRRAFSNFAMIVFTCALVILPGLYAWFNIAAAMDPYGNTSKMAIAVANDDKPVTLTLSGKNTRLDVGDEIISNLKKNHQLGWTFVNHKDALEGVRSGKYWAAIVVPEDFSSTLASLTNFTKPGARLEHPKLDYYVNEKLSGIAPKITDSGATTLDRTINETVVRTASTSVVSALKKSAGSLMDQTGSTADSSARSVTEAAQGLGEVRDGLSDLSSSLSDASASTHQAVSRLEATKRRSTDLSTRIGRANGQIPALQQSVVSLSSRLPAAISTGTSAINEASTAATGISNNATTALNSAVDQASSALSSADTALGQANATLDQLRSLSRQLRDQGQTQAADVLDRVIRTLGSQTSDTGNLISSLQTSTSQARTAVSDLRQLTGTLQSTVSDSASTANSLASQAATAGSTTALNALNSASTAAQSAQDGLSTINTAIDQAQATLGQLGKTLTDLSGTVSDTGTELSSVERALETTATDIAALNSAENVAELRRLLRFNSSSVADFIASPTQITTRAVYSVPQYGAAMTPLYSNVALWMGSLMLAIMIRVEVDATGIGRIRRWQGYLGRYLLFGTIAILQGIVITAGDLVTGIKVVNIPAFLFSGVVQGFVYSSIVYALTVCFQHIGKAIAILLIIMQIPGSAGVYPIEMMPKFYQDLRPWLPWTYGISLMREAIGGMYRLTYGHDILILLVYSALAFFFGLVLRGPMANLNLLMDERLSQTDFFNTENGIDLPKPRVRLTTVVRALIGRPEWRQRVVRRAVAFDKAYPKLIRAAAVVTILVPFLPFAFIASPNEKLATMGLWVVVILLAVAFVIIIEYVHRSLGREVGLSRLSPEQLQALMSEKEGR